MWLAVKHKDHVWLFYQSRAERENQNSVLIDEKKTIETIVVKTFKTKEEAVKYCNDINEVNDFINKLTDE